MSENNINLCGPQTIEQFIGQASVVRRAKVAMEYAWNDRACLPNMLLVGPPGLGKTDFAKVMAREMGVELKESLGQTLNGAGYLAGFLMAMKDRDVGFIDEAHLLDGKTQTLLYRAISENRLFLSGQPFGGNSHVVQLPLFTLLVATTHESCLLKPLRERFNMILPFDFYNEDDLREILRRRTMALKWNAEEDVLKRIAQRSKGIPREALNLLASCRTLARSLYVDTITISHFEQVCELEEIDPLGLRSVERKYLNILAEADKPIRPSVLATKLDLPMATIRDVTEDYLVRGGLVERTERGRVITLKGRDHVRHQNKCIASSTVKASEE